VLLLHRSAFARDYVGDWAWTTPGGAVGPGETPVEGAQRELFEETGLLLDCRVASFHGGRVSFDGGVCHVFHAEAKSDAAVVLSEEHDAYEWVSVEEAARRCLPAWVGAMYRDVVTEVAP
jgi:8-oxo-dGTP pyrophosphatase MutT (NUDIX family)